MDERTLARFMSKVEMQPNGCWHLVGHARRKDGYYNFSVKGKNRLLHRLVCEHFNGPIPEGYEVDHVCHSRDKTCPGGPCVHRQCICPAHLEAVTRLVNIRRGRGISVKNAAKTSCDYGHEFTPQNTYRDPGGGRECRTCRDVRAKEWLTVHHTNPRHGTETHCPSGHRYEGTNLVITVTGGRACRECKRAWDREYMRRKRAAAKAAQTA